MSRGFLCLDVMGVRTRGFAPLGDRQLGVRAVLNPGVVCWESAIASYSWVVLSWTKPL